MPDTTTAAPPRFRLWHGVRLPLTPAGHLAVPAGRAEARPSRAARPKGLAGRDLLAWKMTERPELETFIDGVLTQYAGLIWRFHDQRPERNRAGFPDGLYISHYGVMWRENKAEGYPPTREQAFVLAQLEDHGYDVGLWYPSDRASGRIVAELTALARGPARRPAPPRGLPGPQLAPGAATVTVADQGQADAMVAALAASPALHRVVTVIPAGPVTLRPFLAGGVDLVIAHGPAGPGAAPTHPDWFRTLRDDCAAHRVPFRFGGWGEWAPARPGPRGRERRMDDATRGLAWITRDGTLIRYHDVTVTPHSESALMERVGMASSGDILDGRRHCDTPSDTHHG